MKQGLQLQQLPQKEQVFLMIYVYFIIKKIKEKRYAHEKCEQFKTDINIREAVNILNDNELKLKTGIYKFSKGTDFVALATNTGEVI